GVFLDSASLGATSNKVEVTYQGRVIYEATFTNGMVYEFITSIDTGPIKVQWDKTCVACPKCPKGINNIALKLPNEITFTNFDTVEIYAANPTKTVFYDSAVLSQAAYIAESVLEDEVLVQFDHAHHAMGQAAFHATVGAFAFDNFSTNGEDGVSIDLGRAASCAFSWLPLEMTNQPSPMGAWVQLDFAGSVG